MPNRQREGGRRNAEVEVEVEVAHRDEATRDETSRLKGRGEERRGGVRPTSLHVLLVLVLVLVVVDFKRTVAAQNRTWCQ